MLVHILTLSHFRLSGNFQQWFVTPVELRKFKKRIYFLLSYSTLPGRSTSKTREMSAERLQEVFVRISSFPHISLPSGENSVFSVSLFLESFNDFHSSEIDEKMAGNYSHYFHAIHFHEFFFQAPSLRYRRTLSVFFNFSYFSRPLLWAK